VEDEDRLAGPEFWDDFWEDLTIPATVTDSIFDRTFARLLDSYVLGSSAETLVEVGCAPGRWMAHAARRYGLRVDGYESSPRGAQKTRENLAALDVDGRVLEDDFLTVALDRTFDVVLSLGFIEHFKDPTPVMRRHVELLSPGGLLFLEVPNLRGLVLWLLRRTKSPLLAHHHLEVMDVSVLRSLGEQFELEIEEITYLGGFEPAFVDLRGASVLARAPFSAVSRLRSSLRITDRLNAPWLSGYLCAVMRRPA
jgi:SAM-dependent methyltransferase